MKTINIILVGLILLVAAPAMAKLNKTEAFFIKKSLNDTSILAFLHTYSKGECLPLLLNATPKEEKALSNCKHCCVRITTLEITKDEVTGVVTVYLAYSIDRRFFISQTFESKDLETWACKDKIIRATDRS